MEQASLKPGHKAARPSGGHRGDDRYGQVNCQARAEGASKRGLDSEAARERPRQRLGWTLVALRLDLCAWVGTQDQLDDCPAKSVDIFLDDCPAQL